MSEQGWAVSRVDDIERHGLPRANWLPIRSEFEVRGFDVYGWEAREPGAEVIGTHHGAGKEELYVVLRGHATFVVDSHELEAPAGTLVFVSDPTLQRAAVARETGTMVLAVGGTPAEPFALRAWEYSAKGVALLHQGDIQGACEVLSRGADLHPAAGGLLYNLACAESLLGDRERAVGHLRRAIAIEEGLRERARTDSDFDRIRADAAFSDLVGGAEGAVMAVDPGSPTSAEPGSTS